MSLKFLFISRITPLSTILSNSIPTNLGRLNENTIRSPVGIVRMGQSVDTVFHILVPKLYPSSIPLLDIKIQSEWTGENVSEIRKYSSITIQSLLDITSSKLEQDNIEYQIVRTKAVYVLQQIFEAMISSENLIDPTTILQDFISYIDRVLFTSLLSEKYIKAIRADFSGQVTEVSSVYVNQVTYIITFLIIKYVLYRRYQNQHGLIDGVVIIYHLYNELTSFSNVVILR